MLYRAPRSPALDGLVDGLWFYDHAASHAHERLLASSTVQLLVDLVTGEAFVAGPATRPKVVSTVPMARIAGVVFAPGGMRAFMRAPVEALRDADAPLVDLWGDAGRLLPEQVESELPEASLDRLEQALLRCFDVDRRPHSAMAAALAQLDAGERVVDVAASVGLSRATLARRLRDGVGLSPKGWGSLQRFQRAARRIAAGQRDYTEVALEAGFYDQAHLIHAFRRYAGLTPKRYRPKPGEPNHIVE